MTNSIQTSKWLIIIITLLLGTSLKLYPKANKEQQITESQSITLIVMGEGKTKDEATKVALKSAIEQTFGTFVSANTTILNDENITEEITAISSGNITSYQEISYSSMDNTTYVTLKATVSIGNLVKYAQNKGCRIEISGATIAMNIKLHELKKKNELIAINSLIEKYCEIAKSQKFFNYKLHLGEPQVLNGNDNYDYQLKATIEITPNYYTYKEFFKSLTSTLNEISLSEQEYYDLKMNKVKVNSIIINDFIGNEKRNYIMNGGKFGLNPMETDDQDKCILAYEFLDISTLDFLKLKKKERNKIIQKIIEAYKYDNFIKEHKIIDIINKLKDEIGGGNISNASHKTKDQLARLLMTSQNWSYDNTGWYSNSPNTTYTRHNRHRNGTYNNNSSANERCIRDLLGLNSRFSYDSYLNSDNKERDSMLEKILAKHNEISNSISKISVKLNFRNQISELYFESLVSIFNENMRQFALKDNLGNIWKAKSFDGGATLKYDTFNMCKLLNFSSVNFVIGIDLYYSEKDISNISNINLYFE